MKPWRRCNYLPVHVHAISFENILTCLSITAAWFRHFFMLCFPRLGCGVRPWIPCVDSTGFKASMILTSYKYRPAWPRAGQGGSRQVPGARSRGQGLARQSTQFDTLGPSFKVSLKLTETHWIILRLLMFRSLTVLWKFFYDIDNRDDIWFLGKHAPIFSACPREIYSWK